MLTDNAIKAIKKATKPSKSFDGGGLYLLTTPQGSKLWRLKYRIAGKEKLLALGTYPAISLKDARTARDDARKLIARGADPGEAKKQAQAETANTFAAVAELYTKHLESKPKKPAATTLRKISWQLKDYVLPAIGSKPIASIKPADVLAMLRKIEAKGHLETARKARALCSRIFRHGVGKELLERDPTVDLRGQIDPPTVRSHAAITEPKKVGELLRAIDGYQGQPATAAALKLAPHVFLRPGELRSARWAEIDLDAALWRVPAERTKMRREHLVPLSQQVVAILRELHTITGGDDHVFPAIGPANRPISENTLNGALRRLGYGNNDHVAHGFRATARTIMDEVLGYRVDLIEHQLAHEVKDKNGRAYNRTSHMSERIKMMQGWSDYLDLLKASGNVIAIKRAAQ